MTTIARYAADTSVGLIAKTLEQDGAVIIEGLLDETTVARLNREVDPLLAEADPAMQHLNSSVAAFFGTRVRHLAGLAGKSMTFAEEVMCHPYTSPCATTFSCPIARTTN
ncbi:hypothetical protein ACU4HD_41670 [Cupriavidus basilensis]